MHDQQTEDLPEAALTDPAFTEDPYRYYPKLLRECPVKHEPGVGWLVSRYADVRTMALNTKDFSSSVAGEGGPRHMGVSEEPFSQEVLDLLEQYHPMDNALFTADPPHHTRHRALVNKALNPRRVRKLEGAMRQIAHELVDAFVDDGRCELHTQFGIGLPLTVIADTLGVARADMPAFKHWSDCMLAGNLDVLDNPRRAEVARAVIAFQQYMIPLIEERRETPCDDLLSDLANAEIDDDTAELPGPRRLTTAELLPIVSQLLLAGNETTTNLIGNGLVLLLQHPESMAELRADPTLIPNFLEEVLRFDGPIHCTFRRAQEGAEVLGESFAPGTMVIPMWGAAGQDETVFEDPRSFDIHRRNAKRHLTFGAGIHFCAGAEMARVEGKVAFEVLLERLADIRLAPEADLAHQPSFSARGYRRVDIEFNRPKDRA
ncbi:cytochrome P450 [Patulibacter minatonensis]|uniref:cytochrome P450 n=1 Tax=Patulibacter minatonensis TaxID=298163 RepID=UPI0006865E39|nr:cytochrome P450 [Patulibacter minatonensis]